MVYTRSSKNPHNENVSFPEPVPGCSNPVANETSTIKTRQTVGELVNDASVSSLTKFYIDSFKFDCLNKYTASSVDFSVKQEYEDSDEEQFEEDEDVLKLRQVRNFLQINFQMSELFKILKPKIKDSLSVLSVSSKNTNELSDLVIEFESSLQDFWFKFNSPYFKDRNSFPSLLNNDAKLRIEHGLNAYCSFIKAGRIKNWSFNEKKILCFSVQKQLIEKEMQCLEREEKHLKRTLTDDDQLDGLIADVHRRMERVKEKNLVQLIDGKVDCKIDWDRVSVVGFNCERSSEECSKYWRLYCQPSVNKGEWSKHEEDHLVRLVHKYKHQNWEKISKELGTNRSPFQTFVYFQEKCLPKTKYYNMQIKWTKEKDKELKSVIETCTTDGEIEWREVAALSGRSVGQVRNRWRILINRYPKTVKGKFTKEEDMLVLSGIQKFGVDFFMIASLLKDRTAQQVKSRFERFVNNETVGHWDRCEDNRLLNLIKENGVGEWSKIGKQFVTRSRTQVRQRYETLEKHMDRNGKIKYEGMNKKRTVPKTKV